MVNKENKSESVLYFKDVIKQMNSMDLSPQIIVNISIEFTKCESGTTYAFSAVLKDGDNEKGNEDLGSCNSIADNTGHVFFPTTYIAKYFFEKNQPLTLTIFKSKNKTTKKFTPLTIALGKIIGSRGNTLTQKIEPNSPEEIIIKVTELKDASYVVRLKLKVIQMINFNIKDNQFCYVISNSKNGNLIYRSEMIPVNGIFNEQEIPYDLLSPSFKIEIVNWLNKTLNSYTYDIEQFLNKQVRLISLTLANKITLQLINESRKEEKPSFIDYVNHGVQIALTFGIDFTGSNGHPLDDGSLHQIEGLNDKNDYQNAIKACGDIVSAYDSKRNFTIYGFGAIVEFGQEASMCFNVNMTKTKLTSIDDVLKAYKTTVMNIIFAGPTYFAPIINKVNETITNENNPLSYHILMIMTDGMIDDLQETIDALVIGSFLPLSVIIIGMGDKDFSDMNILDADDNPIYSTDGTKAGRDLVQFVPFDKFKHDGAKLAAEVLEEVPRQVIEYYLMKKIYPKDIIPDSHKY